MKTLLELDVQNLIMLSGLIIPILHGVIGKASATPESKALLTLCLTLVASLVTMVIEGGGVLRQEMFVVWAGNFVAVVTTHYGLFKPLGVTGSSGVTQTATKGVGIALLGSDPEKAQGLSWQ